VKKLALGLVAAAALAALGLAVATHGGPGAAGASSHREAPLISQDPTADTTDLYAFVSPDKPDTATLIANWIPGEDPAAGPNWYTFSPSARYDIYADTNGDGKPDVTWRFRFKNQPGQFFLGNTVQRYSVTKVAGGKTTVVGKGLLTPPDNIGPRTTPNYDAFAAKGVHTLSDGATVFAGQRDDPFFADVGAIFDLVAIREGTGAAGGGKDFLAGYAVHSIALQIPKAMLDNGKSHVVGIWAATDRQRVTVAKGRARTAWVQVSRLGDPLINEVLIPTNLKDHWNATTPAADGQFKKYYSDSILAAVLEKLYPKFGPFKASGRADLVEVLGTGIPKLNFTGPKVMDELRLNLSIPPTPPGKVQNLGVIAGDNAGYPNGRRPADDVVDISERVVGGELIGHKLPLGDGVDANDVKNLGSFPYVPAPFSGYEDTHGGLNPKHS
jgi:hypothetical protein